MTATSREAGHGGAMFRDYFPSKVLYSSMALSANIAGIIAGFTPLIATAVLAWSKNQSWGPASLLALIAAISVVSSFAVLVSVRRHGSQGIDNALVLEDTALPLQDGSR